MPEGERPQERPQRRRRRQPAPQPKKPPRAGHATRRTRRVCHGVTRKLAANVLPRCPSVLVARSVIRYRPARSARPFRRLGRRTRLAPTRSRCVKDPTGRARFPRPGISRIVIVVRAAWLSKYVALMLDRGRVARSPTGDIVRRVRRSAERVGGPPEPAATGCAGVPGVGVVETPLTGITETARVSLRALPRASTTSTLTECSPAPANWCVTLEPAATDPSSNVQLVATIGIQTSSAATELSNGSPTRTLAGTVRC